MFLITVALIIIAFFLGWKLGDKVVAWIIAGARWLLNKIKGIFKKKNA